MCSHVLLILRAGSAFLTADPTATTAAALQTQLQESLCMPPVFTPSVPVPSQCAVRAKARTPVDNESQSSKTHYSFNS